MRYKVQPEDFDVEEQTRLSFVPQGSFAVYRVRKQGVTTMSVQAQMARALNVPQSNVIFPALKDKDAITTQHAAVRGTGPTQLTGNGYRAEFLGRIPRPLSPADIVANRFTIVLRDLSEEETEHIQKRLPQMDRFGLPNYFDQQRFGSLAPGQDHIGKRILRRDTEGALRAYLTLPFVGDPRPVRKFKTFAANHWKDWDALFDAAPRPSNYRSVLTYLRDHPYPTETESRKALNLITRRLLSIYLSAYQSLLWNRIAARQLVERLEKISTHVEIADEQLPLYHEMPAHLEHGLNLTISLPNHRAVYADPDLATIVAHVLAEEGLALNDLKARILKKAYLSKGKRALLLLPQNTFISPPEPDDRFPGRNKLTFAFTLPRGSYATLVVKVLLL
ncbi:MAG: tRNA pseudouridine(13) synthase TruD [Chloroflexi bacterium]|nr:tRNA pseudouridine(13) synthase TruD [Chloroflexota bacterium]